jgi:hypothetical protein
MTDTRTTRRTSDHDAGDDSRKASTRSDTDTGAHSAPASTGTDEASPAVSYAGDGSDGTELPIETHGAHYRGSYGDV